MRRVDGVPFVFVATVLGLVGGACLYCYCVLGLVCPYIVTVLELVALGGDARNLISSVLPPLHNSCVARKHLDRVRRDVAAFIRCGTVCSTIN